MVEEDRRAVKWNFFLGVGLTSLCTLMLQVSLTRLFSVALWHHFAFMVVSIAFLGFAASGTFLVMVPGIRRLRLNVTLSHLALGLSMATEAAYWASNVIPFDPARIMWDRCQWVYLLGYYGVLAVPFFFAGLILALVYTCRTEAVNRFYAFDLAGAGTGCVAAFFILPMVGETGSIIVVAFVAGLASLAFRAGGWGANAVRGSWMLLLCLLLFLKPGFLNLNVSPYKALNVALRYPDARVLETHHDLSARLDVIESDAVRFSPGLSLEFEGTLPGQLGLCLDAGHLNAVTRDTGHPGDLTFTEFLPSAVPYVMGTPSRVLIIEPLGGLDILTARHHGAKHITATHSTPLALKVMRGSLSDFSGNLYGKDVVSVEEEGRSFLVRCEKRFDVIQLPLTNSMGAASSGLYGLSEDYTLTVEAFQAYIRALSPRGFLTVTKYLLPPPRHELRLAALACAALQDLGAAHPDEHVAAVRSWGTFTLIVKKTPFDAGEIRRMKDFCRRLRFDVVHYPGIQRSEANRYNRFPGPLYYDMIRKILNPGSDEGFYDAYLFDVRPVTDDRPFFYHNFRGDKAAQLYRAVGHKWQLFLEGGYLVHLIFFQALVIGCILVALPFAGKSRPSSSWFLSYFGLIGTAFMLTEICLVQRFILFFARPAQAFAVVLFSVLVTSGLGSYFSRNFTVRKEKGEGAAGNRLGPAAFLVITPLLLLAYGVFLDRILLAALVWPLWMRHGAAFLIILPLGFVMGMFFPTGIRILSLQRGEAIPWAWAVNASVSVVGSVLAVVIALSWGFSMVLSTAALVYGLALVALLAVTRKGSWKATTG